VLQWPSNDRVGQARVKHFETPDIGNLLTSFLYLAGWHRFVDPNLCGYCQWFWRSPDEAVRVRLVRLVSRAELKDQPEEVRVHDFQIREPDKGKVAPYGVYDLGRNVGWVSVGCGSRHGGLCG
jgi:hypothetical protein